MWGGWWFRDLTPTLQAITFHEISRTFGTAAELALTDDVLAEREAEAYARLVHARGVPLDTIINDILAPASS